MGLGEKTNLASVGFKAKLYQVCELKWFFYTIQERGFRLIYLKRRNIIKSVLSACNARRLRRKYGLSNAEKTRQVLGPVYVEPEAFLVEFGRRARIERGHEIFFEAYKFEKRMSYYEDLLDNQETFFRDLLGYLGVGFAPLTGKFVKNTPDKLSTAIRNYGEIRSLFSGTCFERLFDE